MFPEGVPTEQQPRKGAVTAPTELLEREWEVGEPVTGIVLAGGRGKRMGYRDKAWLELSGRPLVKWVLDAMTAVTDHQMIVTREAGRMEELGVEVVIDQLAPRGPLTGLHAGLKASSTDLSLVCACDLPLVRRDLLLLLAKAIGASHAAVPYIGEGTPPEPGATSTAREAGLQPLLAAYRRRCIGSLEKALIDGAVPTVAFLSLVQARIILPEQWRGVDPDGRSFFNVNSPEDLTAAARLINLSA